VPSVWFPFKLAERERKKHKNCHLQILKEEISFPNKAANTKVTDKVQVNLLNEANTQEQHLSASVRIHS